MSAGIATPGGGGITITPAALPAGPTEDYEPVSETDWLECTFIRLTSSANAVIGGLLTTLGGQSRVRHFINTNAPGGFTITLLNEGGGGAASSDIISGSGDLILAPGDVGSVWEDQTTGKWRVM